MRWVVSTAGRWGKEFRVELRSADRQILFDFVASTHEEALEEIERMTGDTNMYVIDETRES
jgi:hypothetical protein